jgi:hypothetical protein
MLHFVAPVQCPTRLAETLDQFSTDLISLDRFGSLVAATSKRNVRFAPSKAAATDAKRTGVIAKGQEWTYAPQHDREQQT